MDILAINKNNLKCSSNYKDLKIDPLLDKISSVELIRVSGSDLDVVNAARVSYGKVSDKLTEKDVKLINFLMRHRHTSPFEHNQLSFRIKCPIFVARQWMRHRMNSYNEICYRYVESELEFYIPNEWRYQDKINHQASYGAFLSEEALETYKKGLEQSRESYLNLLKMGVCREQARAVLPVTTYTEFIFTCNLHSFIHFLDLRMSKGAQWEIQKYAEAMYELALPYFKASLEAWNRLRQEK